MVTVLAFSGGPRSARALQWLVAQRAGEIVTLTIDVGQGVELADVRAQALTLGAIRAHVLDVREIFAVQFVRPALAAGARLDGHALGPRALVVPLLAESLVQVAGMEGTPLLAHGCDADEAFRLESDATSLGRPVTFVDTTEAFKGGGVELATVAHRNLWGRTLASPALRDTWEEPHEDLFTLSEAPAAASDLPAFVEIEFEEGRPARVNGVAMTFVDLVVSLETIAGDHGVGRLDLIEPGLGRRRRRVVAEAPAAVVLDTGLRALEALVYDSRLGRLAREVGDTYGAIVADGQWFSPTRAALDGFVARAHTIVSGKVRLRLFKGECRVVGRQAGAARSGAKHE